MPALSLANLGVSTGGGSFGEASRHVGDLKRVAFEDAMNRNGVERAGLEKAGVPAVQPVQAVQPVTAPAQAGPANLENSASSRDRVRRSLELDGAATRPSQGDAILGGLQKLRGTFDARHTRIGEIMGGKTVDTNALLAMQMEVAQYTLLVDVSSKLTGKTTQSLDTLMKGQ